MKKIIATAALALLVGGAGCKKKDDKKGDESTAKGSDQGSGEGSDKGSGDAPKKDDSSGLAGGGKAVETGAPQAKTAAVLEAVDTEKTEQAALESAKPAMDGKKALAAIGTDVQDAGDLKLSMVDNGDNSEWRLATKEVLEKAVALVNGAIKFPRDIPVLMQKCGEPNAYYSPEDGGKIIFCDEWAPFSAEAFGRYKENADEIKRMTMNTVIETFFHELGHCLIDQWKLPATGREEDAADQLAAFALIDEGEDTSQIIMDAAEFWLILAVTRGEMGRNNFADEHSLDQVRFYNFACMVYGSNPNQHVSLVEDYDLPLKRAWRCEDEYRGMRQAWGGLLEKILIQG